VQLARIHRFVGAAQLHVGDLAPIVARLAPFITCRSTTSCAFSDRRRPYS
jgi:hypothetical protein